jgi:hypothetical protein
MNDEKKYKQLRREVDYLYRRAKEMSDTVDPFAPSAWYHIAANSIRMAKCWLGESMRLRGSMSPYTPANTPAEIPAEAEVVNDPLLLSGDSLADINRQRELIKDVISMIGERGILNADQLAINYLKEASFYYGFQLGDIRDAK